MSSKFSKQSFSYSEMEVGRSSPCSIVSLGGIENTINSSTAYKVSSQNDNPLIYTRTYFNDELCNKKRVLENTSESECNFSNSDKQRGRVLFQSSTDIFQMAIRANAPLQTLKFLINTVQDMCSDRVSLLENFERVNKRNKQNHHQHQQSFMSSISPNNCGATKYDDEKASIASGNDPISILVEHLMSAITLGVSSHAVDALEYLLSCSTEEAVVRMWSTYGQSKNPLVKLLCTAGATIEDNANTGRICKAIKLVAFACPSLVGIPSSLYGLTPIHLALMYHGSSLDIVKNLLTANPQAVTTPSIRGDLPIHTAMAYGVPMETLKVVLSATVLTCPELLLHATDSRGLSPIHLAWIKHLDPDFEYRHTKIRKLELYGSLLDEAVQDVMKQVMSSTSSVVTKEYIQHCIESVFGTFWKRTEIYLQNLTKASKTNWTFIHAASAANIPRALMKLLFLLYPEQANVIDSSNQLPLHIAASSPKYPWWCTTTSSCNKSGTKDLLQAVKDDAHPSLIQMLLQVNPSAAASVDNGMQLTLHRAMERRAIEMSIHGSEVECIVNAYPEALHAKDPKSSLYPFMQAAASGSDASVEIIYFLLRQCPYVVSSG